MGVPEPNQCSECILQSLYAFRNERFFYQRNCGLCNKPTITILSEASGHTVYCTKCFWGDKWDATKYGRDFDFSRPFFDQFAELFRETPVVSHIIGNAENSDYTNFSLANKNSYMITASDYNEDSYYSAYLFTCRNAVDCLFTSDSEKVYQLVDCKKCYNSIFLQHCHTCRDSLFCFNCRGLDNCIGCVNLHNKKFHIFNKSYSEEEYFKKKAEFNLTEENIENLHEQMMKFKLQFPHKFAEIENSVDSTGDYLSRCKKCIDCYDILESEDVNHSMLTMGAKDCMYTIGSTKSELNYMSAGSPENYNIKISTFVWPKSRDLEYCIYPQSSKDCFGCVSVNRGQYCILNKQYQKEEYFALVKKIKEHMQRTGEYGQFFTPQISPFAYNETAAQEYFPLTKEKAIALGYRWQDPDPREYKAQTYQVPANIKDVKDEITKEVLQCKDCGKNFRIIIQELKFYRDMNVPVPSKCFDCRHVKRLSLRNPRKLWERQCAKCQAGITTTYAPERPEIVYCEKCYLEAVY
jgi:hypothetical protein